MSLYSILNDREAWAEYDSKKKQKGSTHFFSCSEAWEVDYIVDMIVKHQPKKSPTQIREVIIDQCKKKSGERSEIDILSILCHDWDKD
jgi:hypothetical protein